MMYYSSYACLPRVNLEYCVLKYSPKATTRRLQVMNCDEHNNLGTSKTHGMCKLAWHHKLALWRIWNCDERQCSSPAADLVVCTRAASQCRPFSECLTIHVQCQEPPQGGDGQFTSEILLLVNLFFVILSFAGMRKLSICDEACEVGFKWRWRHHSGTRCRLKVY